MISRIFTSALLLLFAQVLHSQNTIGVTEFQPDLVDEGYTLIYPHNQPNVYLLDLCGEVVHSWSNADTLRPGNVAYLQENGDIVMTYRPQVFSSDPLWAGGGGATVERRTWDNDVLWSYTLNDSTGRLHHDIEVKPDGNVFAIAWEHFSPEEAIQAGRDSALVPEDGLWSEMVVELSPDGNGGANIVWEWHAWDHLVQNLDPSKDNFGVVSENPNKIDVNYGTASAQPSDWLHINAIDYNPYFEHLLLSVPTFDELWIVDYDNFTPGQLLWRWGNPEAYDMGTEEDKQLFYQHDCHWVYDHVTLNNPDFGKIAVFNNRVPSANGGSHSAVHLLNPSYTDYDNNFATDFNNGTFLPADFDWSYVAPDSIYTSGLSSFQRLENGNSLICYGRWGDTREITSDGELAWRYKTPLVNAGGFASPVSQGTEPSINQNMTFRAHRYPSDFPAFQSVMLEPQGVLELNPNPVTACGNITAGCMDAFACNFDSTAVVAGPCTYFDAAYGDGLEFVIGTLNPESGCNGGYAVAESLPLTLAATDSGMMWTFEPDVAQILIDNGFGFVVDDFSTQTLSLCGADMNVMDAAGNDYTLMYDSTGYINMAYFGYVAPVTNFGYGCGFEFACNYDPCSLYDFALCEFLNVSVETTADDGSGNGTASATASGGVEPYEYVWYAGDNEEPFSLENNVDSLVSGDYSVLAVDSTGCIGSFDFVIDYTSGVPSESITLSVFPNPVSDVLRVQVQTAGQGELTLRDLSGRKVFSTQVRNTTTSIDITTLPAGTYVMTYLNGSSVMTRNVQVVR
ncbi:MAG: aryl-sulfate sulfotransferase [Bacteroidetes bacterium]|nr:aryl-sulfate sulfotransferase [Bacteroidota bacterium]